MKRFWALWLVLIIFPVSQSQAKVYIDQLGREMTLGKPPRRIVSLSPGITEILFALGLEHSIAGVTEFSDYPAAAKHKPRVGSYVNLSLETIVSLNPDLIIASADGNRKDDIEKLAGWGLAVYVVNPQNLQQILNTIQDLGRITGQEQQAKTIVADMRRRKQAVTEAVAELSRRRVFVQIESNPLITVGQNTFWDNLISLAGGKNIVSGKATGYPRYNLEDVLLSKPDIILVTSMVPTGKEHQQLAFWMSWKAIPAVRDDRVYVINPDLVDRPGPRIIEGLERLARIIHPEAGFSQP